MRYKLGYKPLSIRDFEALPKDIARRILDKITVMSDGLVGDVKRLKNTDPRYRLRVGDYRVLFNIEGDTIMIYRVHHRREAYDR